MGARQALFDAIDSMVDFGRVVASSLSANARNLLVEIEGNDAGGESPERVENQPLWQNAALLFRPKAPTNAGHFEVAFMRRGEELIGIATRDTRIQVTLAEGDVCVTSLDPTNPVRIWLKANGEALIEANSVRVGDNVTTQKIGLGTAIKGHLDAVKTFLDAFKIWANAHQHLETGATTNTPTVPFASAVPSVPTVESANHYVEP